ncbi:related to Chitin-binding protein [Sporisorium reilianum f. sp. reilianum]|uniref:Related to Chitin-binding protein n=1 Tax=Sporisorium reilianum f. sp. reilianum TaxID=72559 RepID=A0A2N8UL07_9BASI|nr:related to Chitin-binding protein [Sporisorium reilianum f. sp. reilianum]
MASLSLFQLVALVAFLFTLVDAHGYINSPASRSYMCKQGTAKNCGEIQYEPQSLEALKGLPFARGSDGKLCSAGLSQFAQLDRQGPGVWPTTKASNVHSFSWTFTAMHATTDFKYYITKSSWDSSTSKGLSASDFDAEPFLVVPMGGKPPAASMTHDLSKSLPSRSGYHVVYAVWTVDNTVNAFYQCIDLDFGGGNSKADAAASSSAPNTSNATSASTNNTGASSSSVSSPAAAASSPSANTGSSGASAANPKSHAVKGNAAGCRMKRKRAPSASILAARGDYRRHRLQTQRERQA